MTKIFISITSFAILLTVNTAIAKTNKAIGGKETIEAYGRVHYPEEYKGEPSDEVAKKMGIMGEDGNGLLFIFTDDETIIIVSSNKETLDNDVKISEDEDIAEILKLADTEDK